MAVRGRELILLDTHVWIWAFEPNPKLSSLHRKMIEENPNRLAISAASLWELSMLVFKGRIELPVSMERWFEFSTESAGVVVLPLDGPTAKEAYQLPGHFHDDPADRIIVASARLYDGILLTEDSKILNYPHVQAQ